MQRTKFNHRVPASFSQSQIDELTAEARRTDRSIAWVIRNRTFPPKQEAMK